MPFDTVYDIREAGCRDSFLVLIGLALMATTAVAWSRSKTSRTPALALAPRPTWSPSPGFGLVFFGFWTFIAFAATWGEYWHLLRGIRTGAAQSIEGIVMSFQPAATEKGTERFSLGGHEFSYSRVATNQGFHTLAADGGPIVDGAHVRILYIGNHILRVEIARAGSGALPAAPSAHNMDPPTTIIAPSMLSRFSCSGFTRPGTKRSSIHIAAIVKSGVSVSVAPTRDASQCLSASANAPYAITVLAQQKTSIHACSVSTFRIAAGCEAGNSTTAAPI